MDSELRRHVRLAPRADGARLRAGFDQARAELAVPTRFPRSVLAEAEDAARSRLLPDVDLTDVPFVTVDPPGSTDLDQAMHLSRRAAGYRVRYAIADVAAFVEPGAALDAETHRRVETLYAPDVKTPLHPPALSEGAASLLPGQGRPAVVWEIDLDASGAVTATSVRRAVVRSREQLAYADVQAGLDDGTAPDWALLLREVGRLREEQEAARGGVSLPIPEQEVVPAGDAYALELRSQLPVERWNAQISLLTGMVAARMALDGGIGILRTLPSATSEGLDQLRRAAAGLGIDWPATESYPELIRRLDPKAPAHAALLQEATGLMRGAGYAVVDAAAGTDRSEMVHGAIAAPYSHVTAPLRRLVDRYAGEVCLALCAGRDVPDWVSAALATLPDEMATGARLSGALERACVDLVEAAVLAPRVGEVFTAVVVDVSSSGGSIHVVDPPVRAHCDGEGLPLGQRIDVRLVSASVDERRVLFVPA